eukprot:scaffold19464_cov63-Phaeocystis_antarctica.AAC.4
MRAARAVSRRGGALPADNTFTRELGGEGEARVDANGKNGGTSGRNSPSRPRESSVVVRW